MKLYIELISVGIIVIAFASLLGGYAVGFDMSIGVSDVAAQEDHGDDGGDYGGDVSSGDDHGDGGGDVSSGDDHGDGGGDDHGDGGDDHGDDGGVDHVSGSEEHFDVDTRYVIGGCITCGKFVDPACLDCGGYIDGDPASYAGIKEFDPSVGLYFLIPQEGTLYNPRAGDVAGINQHVDDDGEFVGGTELFLSNDFQLNAGGMAADADAGLFFDPTTGQVFDLAGVQFFDAVTGEPIDLDLGSDRYTKGDFTYGYNPDAALGFRGHIVGGTDVIRGGDYQLNAGGLATDFGAGRFLDPTSGQVFDSSGVQFFDPDTGDEFELDYNAAWYINGDFTYGFLPEAALGYRDQSVGGLEVFVGGEFQLNAGGMSVDAAAGLFYEPGSGQVFDSSGVQFFDPTTGEELEFDLTSDWYASGDFTYGYVSEAALGFKPRVNLGFRSEEAVVAYERNANLTAEDILEKGSDFAHDLAEELDHIGFQDLGADTVFGIFEAMGDDQFSSLESHQKASMFAAMNGFQIQGFDPSDVAAVASAMSSQDFTLLDPDSAFGIFNSIGFGASLDLGAHSLAGLIGGFDGSEFSELGADQISEIVGTLDHGLLSGLEDNQAFSMALEMTSGHFDNLTSGQISGLTAAIDANNIGTLGQSVLESIVKGIESDDLSALGEEQARKIFQGVGDDTITGLPKASKEAALEALNIGFFVRGQRFNIDLPVDTIVDQIKVETPLLLIEILKDEIAGLFLPPSDCRATNSCVAPVIETKPVAVSFDLTASSGSGGRVSPSGTNVFSAGTQVTVIATPDAGFIFTGWSGDCSGSGDCTLAMDADKTVSAAFSFVELPTTVPIHLWMSNQSLNEANSEVRMAVSLDGQVVFDQSLAVGDQHNVVIVTENIPLGSTAIDVSVRSPFATFHEVIDVSSELWLLVRFWYDPNSAHENQRTPTISVHSFDTAPGIK